MRPCAICEKAPQWARPLKLILSAARMSFGSRLVSPKAGTRNQAAKELREALNKSTPWPWIRTCPICFSISWVCENHPDRATPSRLRVQRRRAVQMQQSRRAGHKRRCDALRPHTEWTAMAQFAVGRLLPRRASRRLACLVHKAQRRLDGLLPQIVRGGVGCL
jgi:hypothetical protein